MRIFVGGKDEAVEAMNLRPFECEDDAKNAGRAYKPRWQEESMFQARAPERRAARARGAHTRARSSRAQVLSWEQATTRPGHTRKPTHAPTHKPTRQP